MIIEEIIKYNENFVASKAYEKYLTSKYPDKKLAILSCMDTRLTELLPAALGLKNGDAKLIKNAGGLVISPFDSAMRSLLVAIYELGVEEIMVIAHSNCGACHMNGQQMKELMLKRGIHASFALGGITAHMVKMHEEGLIGRLIDVQSFDKVAAESIKNDPFHKGVSANEYASADEPGSAVHYLDIVILSALEVDVNFNINVLVGSDGVIRGAIGGHPDTAADSALSIIVCPLMRGRIPCVVDEVTTLITPGSTVDVVVTEYGIAVNPRRPEIAERLREAGLKIVDINDLKNLALKNIGTPDPLPFGDKVVGVVMNRDGSVMDVIMNIED